MDQARCAVTAPQGRLSTEGATVAADEIRALAVDAFAADDPPPATVTVNAVTAGDPTPITAKPSPC